MQSRRLRNAQFLSGSQFALLIPPWVNTVASSFKDRFRNRRKAAPVSDSHSAAGYILTAPDTGRRGTVYAVDFYSCWFSGASRRTSAGVHAT
jgi:hypothetical protein